MKGICFIFGLFIFNSVSANESKWQIILESGMLYQIKSDVQIPPDTGTRFSLVDAIGKGPLPYARLEIKYDLNARHRLRLLIAPPCNRRKRVVGQNSNI